MAETKQYYKRLLKVVKEMDELSVYAEEEKTLNKSERKLLAVLCMAETEGIRMISTQIASKLGVTRSAVSQMVDKMEGLGIVKRVSSPTDKKIAYIELSSEVKRRYEESVDESCVILERVFSRMGENEVKKMLELADCFTRTVKAVKEETACKR